MRVLIIAAARCPGEALVQTSPMEIGGGVSVNAGDVNIPSD
jgi:hypothetical protein